MSAVSDIPKVGLVLSGGGARGAYQAGVLKAVAEITQTSCKRFPFPIITGVSAGAINAGFIASCSDDFFAGANRLCEIWKSLTTEQVFRTDAFSLGRIGFRWFSDVSIGNLQDQTNIKALLDTKPLRKLLEVIPYDRIQKNIDEGNLEALAITALDYSNSCNVTFVQGAEKTPTWNRIRRIAVKEKIRLEHIMASSAIPLFFPPVSVNGRFFGDGCLRNTAPLSPAVHLECDRLMIIGVKKQSSSPGEGERAQLRPSVARIMSVILNGVLLDAIDIDVERLGRVNETMALLPREIRERTDYKRIDYSWIRPSEDLGAIAVQYSHKLPRLIRFLLGGLGTPQESSEITSYLLFDPSYCGALVDIGYEDGLRQRDEILRLFSTDPNLSVVSR